MTPDYALLHQLRRQVDALPTNLRETLAPTVAALEAMLVDSPESLLGIGFIAGMAATGSQHTAKSPAETLRSSVAILHERVAALPQAHRAALLPTLHHITEALTLQISVLAVITACEDERLQDALRQAWAMMKESEGVPSD